MGIYSGRLFVPKGERSRTKRFVRAYIEQSGPRRGESSPLQRDSETAKALYSEGPLGIYCASSPKGNHYVFSCPKGKASGPSLSLALYCVPLLSYPEGPLAFRQRSGPKAFRQLCAPEGGAIYCGRSPLRGEAHSYVLAFQTEKRGVANKSPSGASLSERIQQRKSPQGTTTKRKSRAFRPFGGTVMWQKPKGLRSSGTLYPIGAKIYAPLLSPLWGA